MQNIIVGAIISLVVSIITAYLTTYLKMKDEQKKWLRDFALKYAEIQNDFPAKAEKIAKQFGIGIIIIEQENITERQKYLLHQIQDF